VTPLLQSLQTRFAELPPSVIGTGALADARCSAWAATLADGLPGPRSESWKYTSLRAFERRSFVAAEATSIDPGLLSAIPAPRIVFVNGRFDAGLSQVEGLADGITLAPLSSLLATGDASVSAFVARQFEGREAAFARINAALASEGAVLRAREGCKAHAPLHLVFVGAPQSADATWSTASLIELAAGAELCVVEHHLAADGHAHFSNGRVQVALGERARLIHARLQDDAAAATQINRSDARLAARACYHRVDLELGSGLSRHELNVVLAGDGAELVANGVLLADGRRHIDTRLGILHEAGNTSSEMNWRGLGAARGRAVFHGGIVIAAGADGSAAALSNKNLLLSDEAEIDTQPVLEIHADEVRAAHGATVGQLDPTAMFYLRSRGLPADEARRLLTVAFCREPLAAIEDSALSALLAAQLDARLHAGGAL